jgi:hypothetical protein
MSNKNYNDGIQFRRPSKKPLLERSREEYIIDMLQYLQHKINLLEKDFKKWEENNKIN